MRSLLRSFPLLQKQRLHLSFSLLHFSLGVSLHAVQFGKYAQDRLLLLNVSVPFLYLSFGFRPRVRRWRR